MEEISKGLFLSDPHNTWVRLRTLVMLRWIAITGQALAVAGSDFLFDLALDPGLFAAIIGLSVLANVVFTFVYPPNKRLGEGEVTAMLLFDAAQIAALLFLSGGLNNPFAILIVAPVTVAATALSTRATVLVGLAAGLLVSALAVFFVPLRTVSGEVLEVDRIFIIGIWAAVLVTLAFLGLYTRRVSSEMRAMSEALLATQMALSREQTLTDLGGVVAAAAHELGTPLATINLVATEMAEELCDSGEMCEDARLIREQALRCRDILRSMGKAGKDDLLLRQAPLGAVVQEAAEPHLDRGKTIRFRVGDDQLDPADQPVIFRRPEIVHGLRNLIQNAVDFASSTVWVDVCWNDKGMSVRVTDDGAGYAPHVIGEIGEPFVGRRKAAESDTARPSYEGMGLGLFIAKTLLERTGAELSFANGTEPFDGVARPGEKSGAIAVATWPRGRDGVEATEKTPALGKNAPIST